MNDTQNAAEKSHGNKKVTGRTFWDFLTETIAQFGWGILMLVGVLYAFYTLNKDHQAQIENANNALRTSYTVVSEMQSSVITDIRNGIEIMRTQRIDLQQAQNETSKAREEVVIGNFKRLNTFVVQSRFANMRSAVDGFVETTYRPFIVNYAFDAMNITDQIVLATKDDLDGGKDISSLLNIFMEKTNAEVKSYRNKLIAPINKMESSMISSIQRTTDTNEILNIQELTGSVEDRIRTSVALSRSNPEDLESKVYELVDSTRKLTSTLENLETSKKLIEDIREELKE